MFHRRVPILLLSLALCIAALAQVPTSPQKLSSAQRKDTRRTTTTAPSKSVLNQLISREKDLAAAQQRHARAVIDETLSDDFHELATDGRVYSKAEIMPMLPDIKIEDFTQSDFQTFPLSEDCVILTYTSTVKGIYKGEPIPPKVAISSVWRRRHGSWRVVFHQATPVAEE